MLLWKDFACFQFFINELIIGEVGSTVTIFLGPVQTMAKFREEKRLDQ